MSRQNNVTRTGLKRFRWWFIPVILVPIAVGTFIHWLNKPLPRPVVSLSLVGFKSTPTNTYALMCLSNSGPTTIYFDPWFWDAKFWMPSGLITNDSRGAGISILYLGTLPGSNEFFGVPIPAKSTNWQVQTECSYFRKRHVRLEIGEWLVRHNVQFDVLWKPLEAIGAILEKLFPEPKSDWVVTSTGWMTNLPPPNSSAH